MSPTVILPTPELPANAVLVVEAVPRGGLDRSAGWRGYLNTDGCWTVQRNRALSVPAEQRQATDPTLFWSSPWPAAPSICLPSPAAERVRARIDEVPWTTLDPFYPAPAGAEIHGGYVERWTVPGRGMVIAEGLRTWWSSGPLAQLRLVTEALDEGVTEAKTGPSSSP
jgi:hypothetical protein